MQDTGFDPLGLRAELLANLATLEYHEMTPVQALSLPPIIAGKDVIGQGRTGSGKTAAFGLGLLQKLDVGRFRIQALVLCPTRELADQVATELRRLGRGLHNIKVLTLCGGVPIGPQIGSLEHGAHIVVGTPGRIEDHLRKGTLVLNEVDTLVLDEADRMLEMGFQASLDNIISHVPAQRQTLLFSATFPEAIENLAGSLLQNPERVTVDESASQPLITQHFYMVNSNGEDRHRALQLLLQQFRPASALVFCATRRDVDEVAAMLNSNDFSALPLHGDLEQRDRDQTLIRFTHGSVLVLVATDVAARGLDIDDLDMVINYHPARDAETHVHRIGRTGRAGSTGVACTLFTDREQHRLDRMGVLPGTADGLPSEAVLKQKTPYPVMVTLQIDGGRRQKLRPGDIVGALTRNSDIGADQIGRIHVTDNQAYVAVHQSAAKAALERLGHGQMKGRKFRVRKL